MSNNHNPSQPITSEDLIHRLGKYIAALSVVCIVLHLLALFMPAPFDVWSDIPLYIGLGFGGLPLVADLLLKALRGNFGSDLLAGIAIVTAILIGEYLAGVLVVLMLSGGEALEALAVKRASAVLEALARRSPSVAHIKREGKLIDVPVDSVEIGDNLIVLPHEICPVDGEVVEGRSTMDESYLTGEPFLLPKTPGCEVISGAINGEGAVTIRALKKSVDSRFASIIKVIDASRQKRPQIRRLGDQLGALYTPFAVAIAAIAWAISGESTRFLAVLVVATPCPLLISIPVTILGIISLAAKRGIIIRDPAVLEQTSECEVMILDKTGTLSHGEPKLSHLIPLADFEKNEILRLAASLEVYSKHPLAQAVISAAQQSQLQIVEANEVHERPGAGLEGLIAQRHVQITGRSKLSHEMHASLPEQASGLECIVLIDRKPAALLRFHDEPRSDSAQFIGHLGPSHQMNKIMIVSGDRESEVAYLAEKVGVREVVFDATPQQKVDIVQNLSKQSKTLFIGDGINDAPALLAATVGVAFGPRSDITSESAGAVIMEPTLRKIDEFLHLGHHMRTIAMQSALGGMAASVIGMGFAAAGMLTPVAGAILQEAIDLLSVLNALRAAKPPKVVSDY